MTPEEEFDQNMWRMLRQIKSAQLLTPVQEKIKLKLLDDDYILSIDTQRKLLYKLKEWGTIYLTADFEDELYLRMDNPTKFIIALNQLKFDQIYNQYVKKEAKKKRYNNTKTVFKRILLCSKNILKWILKTTIPILKDKILF